MSRTALVTGANRGIGRAVAVALERAGLHVLATGRHELDVSDGDSVQRYAAGLADDGAGAPRTPEDGADTIVWLATLPADGPTDGFFRDRAPIPW